VARVGLRRVSPIAGIGQRSRVPIAVSQALHAAWTTNPKRQVRIAPFVRKTLVYSRHNRQRQWILELNNVGLAMLVCWLERKLSLVRHVIVDTTAHRLTVRTLVRIAANIGVTLYSANMHIRLTTALHFHNPVSKNVRTTVEEAKDLYQIVMMTRWHVLLRRCDTKHGRNALKLTEQLVPIAKLLVLLLQSTCVQFSQITPFSTNLLPHWTKAMPDESKGTWIST
jgi:hypothetical protein